MRKEITRIFVFALRPWTKVHDTVLTWIISQKQVITLYYNAKVKHRYFNIVDTSLSLTECQGRLNLPPMKGKAWSKLVMPL